jgi:hypothetical protein
MCAWLSFEDALTIAVLIPGAATMLINVANTEFATFFLTEHRGTEESCEEHHACDGAICA